MQTLKLHDIKALENIPDYSLYVFIIICLFAIAVLLYLVILSLRYFKKKNNPRKEYFLILKNTDLKNPKQTAYTFSQYGRYLIKSEREKKLYEELYEDLEQYKYQKNTPKLNTHTLQKIEIFMESIDV